MADTGTAEKDRSIADMVSDPRIQQEVLAAIKVANGDSELRKRGARETVDFMERNAVDFKSLGNWQKHGIATTREEFDTLYAGTAGGLEPV